MWKVLKKRLWLLPLISLLLLLIINRAPDTCVLCDNLPMHAPCLLNLSTGELGEMVVYDPHPVKIGEIAPEQPGGILGFYPCAGYRAVRHSANWTTTLDIPLHGDSMRKSHFCKSCRKLLADYNQDSFAIVDMYSHGAPVLYPVAHGARYKMRCYRVEVKESTRYTITVTGNLKWDG